MEINKLKKYLNKKLYATIDNKKHRVILREIIEEEKIARVSQDGKPQIVLISELWA